MSVWRAPRLARPFPPLSSAGARRSVTSRRLRGTANCYQASAAGALAPSTAPWLPPPRPGGLHRALVASTTPWCRCRRCWRPPLRRASRTGGLHRARGSRRALVRWWLLPPCPRFAPPPGAVPWRPPPAQGARHALVASTAPELRLPLPGAAGAAPPRPRLGCLPWWRPPRPSFGCRALVATTAPELRLPRPGGHHRARASAAAPWCHPPRPVPPRARGSAAAPWWATTGPSFGCRALVPLPVRHSARASRRAADAFHRPEVRAEAAAPLAPEWRRVLAPSIRARASRRWWASTTPEVCAAPWCRCLSATAPEPRAAPLMYSTGSRIAP
jgi:hypothetical protein